MPAISYRIWQWSERADQGIMQSYDVQLNGIAKSTDDENPYAVINEVVCGTLAHGICLPIPVGFVTDKEGAKYYVSLDFAGERLPPIDGAQFVQEQPDLACGIVLFDIWIVNRDRHARNLSYQVAIGQTQIFDHSHAFLEVEGTNRLTAHENDLGIETHCLAEHLETIRPMQPWFERINQLPEYWVSETMERAVHVGLPVEEAQFCMEFLLRRRSRLLELVAAHRASFPRVQVDLWGEIEGS